MAYDANRIFLQVVQHLEMTPSVSLAQLSSNLGIERHTIEKTVKNATGSTFREFRARALLKRAYGLLTDQSNRSIKEVAFALGYRSQGSFHDLSELRQGTQRKNSRQSKVRKLRDAALVSCNLPLMFNK